MVPLMLLVSSATADYMELRRELQVETGKTGRGNGASNSLPEDRRVKRYDSNLRG